MSEQILSNTYINTYQSIKITPSIKKEEYAVWRNVFPGLNFPKGSKSRISIILGPVLFSIDFGVLMDKTIYEPTLLIFPLLPDELKTSFSWNLMGLVGSPKFLMYYPFNEDREIVSHLYTEMGIPKPPNQAQKTEIIEKIKEKVYLFEGDVTTKHFKKLFSSINQASNSWGSDYNYTVSQLFIMICIYVYLDQISLAIETYNKLHELLKNFEKKQKFGVSVPYNNKLMERLNHLIKNRTQFLRSMDKELLLPKYTTLDKVDIRFE